MCLTPLVDSMFGKPKLGSHKGFQQDMHNVDCTANFAIGSTDSRSDWKNLVFQ